MFCPWFLPLCSVLLPVFQDVNKLFYSVTASSSEWAETSAAVDQITFNLIEVDSRRYCDHSHHQTNTEVLGGAVVMSESDRVVLTTLKWKEFGRTGSAMLQVRKMVGCQADKGWASDCWS